jgi:hypothetical protein
MVQAQQAAALVDDHAHRIEADRAGGRPRLALVRKPRSRESPQACALAGEARAARLDLHEREHPPIEHDQVDLAVAGAHVARKRCEAQAGEVLGREILAKPSHRSTGVGGALASR